MDFSFIPPALSLLLIIDNIPFESIFKSILDFYIFSTKISFALLKIFKIT